jgi:hypothetical protein
VIAPVPRWRYVGTVDPATRGASWTLLVMTADADERRIVVHHREWAADDGTAVPIAVPLAEMLKLQTLYRLDGFLSDQTPSTRVRDAAAAVGCEIHTREMTPRLWHDAFESLRILVDTKRIELPNDVDMRDDLLNVRRKLTFAGPGVELPTAAAGRHADYARLLALACAEPIEPPPRPPDPRDEEAEIIAALEREASPFDRATSRLDFWHPRRAPDTLRRR